MKTVKINHENVGIHIPFVPTDPVGWGLKNFISHAAYIVINRNNI